MSSRHCGWLQPQQRLMVKVTCHGARHAESVGAASAGAAYCVITVTRCTANSVRFCAHTAATGPPRKVPLRCTCGSTQARSPLRATFVTTLLATTTHCGGTRCGTLATGLTSAHTALTLVFRYISDLLFFTIISCSLQQHLSCWHFQLQYFKIMLQHCRMLGFAISYKMNEKW